ncbi:hypothetical protein ACOTHJ_13565 [Achromobacter xylosoxidans]
MTLFKQLHARLQNAWVFSYRSLCGLILGGILLGAFGYVLTIILYTVNSSWVAPIILSKASPRVMATSAEAFRARQGLSAIQVQVDSLTNEVALLDEQEGTLADLLGRYDDAMKAETKAGAVFAGRLSGLQASKRADDAKAAKMAQSNAALERSIDAELAAGLITQEAAVRARAQIVSMEAAVTTGKLSTASLDHQVHELSGGVATMKGQAQSTKALETLAHVAALKRQLSEVQIQLAKSTKELENKKREATELQAIVDTVESTPFFRLAQRGGDAGQFAFVPYSNESAVQEGKSVYSCWAEVILCSKVGTVKWVGRDEEKGFHPIFKRDLRGVLIELELKDPAAAKDKVLFLGSGPLFL